MRYDDVMKILAKTKRPRLPLRKRGQMRVSSQKNWPVPCTRERRDTFP